MSVSPFGQSSWCRSRKLMGVNSANQTQVKSRRAGGDSERWHTPFLERLGFGGAAGRRGSCACKRASLWNLNRIRGKKRQVADKNEWEAKRKAKPHKTKIKLKTRIRIRISTTVWKKELNHHCSKAFWETRSTVAL